MPQPYDYTPNQPPGQAFAQGLQFSLGLRMQQAIQGLRENPRPEAFAEFYLAFPEAREQVQAYQTSLAETDKNTLLSASREALLLRQAGREEEVSALFDRYAEAANNSNRPDLARQFEDAKRAYEIDPDKTGDFALRMMFESLDSDGYKQFFGNESATTFEKDFNFINETFGEDAAAEFAQFGRGGVVSIPLGNGQTYVGPASMAPGASRWQQRGEGEAAPEVDGVPQIFERAADAKTITAAEAGVVQRSMGPNGRAQFQAWLKDQGIKVIVRTGTAADGRRVVQYEDGTVEYAD